MDGSASWSALSKRVIALPAEVVVARKIGGIESHEDYNMLCKNRPDAEFSLLQKLVRQCQRHRHPLL